MPAVELPSGLVVYGRRRNAPPAGGADLLIALGSGPLPPWVARVVRWPDFGLPLSTADALDALEVGLSRARAGERVEISCRGGRGRTGTAPAAMAILDGLHPGSAVAWVRATYDRRAVDTPWQAWWVRYRVAGR
ncbi:protein-tyrosine phosphatase family protein [Nakamurella deserti]|uniref:protein-tyrosine phosphatase family protein n=1 Tax=Nakamurella deserti TaxID=2164074 RepID=UPI000DBE747E|nr:protein phosphatase [Nakamurella deserti]